jgi:hypothetical protein
MSRDQKTKIRFPRLRSRCDSVWKLQGRKLPYLLQLPAAFFASFHLSPITHTPCVYGHISYCYGLTSVFLLKGPQHSHSWPISSTFKVNNRESSPSHSSNLLLFSLGQKRTQSLLRTHTIELTPLE